MGLMLKVLASVNARMCFCSKSRSNEVFCNSVNAAHIAHLSDILVLYHHAFFKLTQKHDVI